MNNSPGLPVRRVPALASVLLAGLVLAGSALAESIPRSRLSSVESDRADRRCTSSTLSADATAPCSDDAVNDRQRVLPAVVRPPLNRRAGSRKPSAGTATQPIPGGSGSAAAGTTGAGYNGSATERTGIHQPAR